MLFLNGPSKVGAAKMLTEPRLKKKLRTIGVMGYNRFRIILIDLAVCLHMLVSQVAYIYTILLTLLALLVLLALLKVKQKTLFF